MIYLDNAATTQTDPRVKRAYVAALEKCWGNPSSPHSAGRIARAAIDDARLRVAELSGFKPSEIIFTGSGSESITLALRGVCLAHKTPGSIITQATEHKAVLETCRDLERDGWRIVVLPVDHDGRIDLVDLENAVTTDTALVSVQWANNETGTLQPIEEIAAICRRKGVPYHCDAMQCVGIEPWPKNAPDMLSVAGHKFHGPKGIGALFCRESVELRPVIRGGGQEHDLRSGTEDAPSIVGFAEAFALATQERAASHATLERLRTKLVKSLDSLGANVRGHGTARLPNIINAGFSGIDGETLVIKLDMAGICVSTGSACTTGSSEPSHVLLAMGCDQKESSEVIRISTCKYSTEEEVDRFIEVLHSMVKP